MHGVFAVCAYIIQNLHIDTDHLFPGKSEGIQGTGFDQVFQVPFIQILVRHPFRKVIQIPEGTVKSRLHAGRAKLRSVLGEEEVNV